MTARFAAVLFDMDGVVVDNMPLHRQVWREFAERQGLTLDEPRLRALDGRRAADIVRHLLGEQLTDDEVLVHARQREAMYAMKLGETKLVAVPGVIAFLDDLGRRGIPRVLATSAVPGNVTRVLDALQLHGHFDALVTAADVARGKPDPEVYHTAAAKAGARAEDCLVAEDALPRHHHQRVRRRPPEGRRRLDGPRLHLPARPTGRPALKKETPFP